MPEQAVEFVCKGAASRYVGCGPDLFFNLRDLLTAHPTLANADDLSELCKVAIHLKQGNSWDVILSPADFTKAYQQSLEKSADNFDLDAICPGDFGSFNLRLLRAPRRCSDYITFFAYDNEHQVPYRVVLSLLDGSTEFTALERE